MPRAYQVGFVSCAHPRARERKCPQAVWLLGIWSLPIGNRTAVLLNRLFSSECCGIVIDVEKGLDFLHYY